MSTTITERVTFPDSYILPSSFLTKHGFERDEQTGEWLLTGEQSFIDTFLDWLDEHDDREAEQWETLIATAPRNSKSAPCAVCGELVPARGGTTRWAESQVKGKEVVHLQRFNECAIRPITHDLSYGFI